MIPLVVMMGDVLLQRVTQRVLPEQDELRKTFLFDRSHPALRESIQIRAPRRQPDRRYANALNGVPERLAELGVPVVVWSMSHRANLDVYETKLTFGAGDKKNYSNK